jgi:hypothetical protein
MPVAVMTVAVVAEETARGVATAVVRVAAITAAKAPAE